MRRKGSEGGRPLGRVPRDVTPGVTRKHPASQQPVRKLAVPLNRDDCRESRLDRPRSGRPGRRRTRGQAEPQ
eukprot:15481077-Alexandrium_andersonii.AAC.1